MYNSYGVAPDNIVLDLFWEGENDDTVSFLGTSNSGIQVKDEGSIEEKDEVTEYCSEPSISTESDTEGSEASDGTSDHETR